MIAKIKAWWKSHGTKILGTIQAAWATFVGYLAWLSAQPDVQFLLPHKYFAWFAIASGTLGLMTVKRGFTNSRPPQ